MLRFVSILTTNRRLTVINDSTLSFLVAKWQRYLVTKEVAYKIGLLLVSILRYYVCLLRFSEYLNKVLEYLWILSFSFNNSIFNIVCKAETV